MDDTHADRYSSFSLTHTPLSSIFGSDVRYTILLLPPVLVRSIRGKWRTPVFLKTTFPYSINYKYDGVIGVALVLSMEYNFYYH